MLAAVLSCINYYNKAKELALLSQNSKLIHELHRMQFQAWKHSDLLLNVVQVVTVSVHTSLFVTASAWESYVVGRVKTRQ